MNLFSKTKLPLLFISAVSLVGCDSSTPLAVGGIALDDITPTDNFVVNGELFTLEDTLNLTAQNVSNFRVISDNTLIEGIDFNQGDGEPSFTYQKTGEFTASISGAQDVDNIVPNAVVQAFSTDNAANTEIRSLLLVTDPTEPAPDLSAEELDRVVELFNISGAGFFRESLTSETLLVNTTEVWNFTSTSTQQDRATGLIGGTYSFEAASREIGFEITLLQDAEGQSFQFYFPVVLPELLPLELFEQGTYTLQLVNEVGF